MTDTPEENKACCGEWETCSRPCVPRGEHRAQERFARALTSASKHIPHEFADIVTKEFWNLLNGHPEKVVSETGDIPRDAGSAYDAGLEAAAKEVESHWNHSETEVNQQAQASRSAAAIRRLKRNAAPQAGPVSEDPGGQAGAPAVAAPTVSPDKQETPRTNAFVEACIESGRGCGYEQLVPLCHQLERELAMMTEAHETCKRCFAEAERNLSARGDTFSPAQALCILRCRDAMIEQDKEEAWHWLYTLDSKQTGHDPFNPWKALETLAGSSYVKVYPRRTNEGLS